MKKTITILLAAVMLLSLSACFGGCDNRQSAVGDHQQSQRTKLLEADEVKSVSVTSLPESYRHSFGGEDAQAIADYLANLNLLADFKEDPDEYDGMTWVISLEYENGNVETVYHLGNMFVRTEHGPWYRMADGEARRFDDLLKLPTAVRTYERTPLEQSVITDLETVSSEDDLQRFERRIILRTYDEMSDGSWRADGYTYKYRLEISGTMPNAEGNSTFVYLSNLESITFEQAWRAAGLSSHTADYFSRDEAVLVELISN